MKILTMIIALIFSMTALADTAGRISLERSFDEFQYSISTEWDQKDEAFLNRARAILERDLNELIVTGAITEEDILTILENRSFSKTDINVLKVRLQMAKASGTQGSLRVIEEEIKKSAQTGASWNGSSGEGIALGLALAAMLAVTIWIFSPPGKCIETAEYLDCLDNGTDCKYVTHCKTYAL